MEAVIKYFEELEARFTSVEERLTEQEARLQAIEKQLADLQAAMAECDKRREAAMATLTARVAILEEKPVVVQAVTPQMVTSASPIVEQVEPEQPALADEENIAIDEETGLPELEVEIVEEEEPAEAEFEQPKAEQPEPEQIKPEQPKPAEQPQQTILDAAQKDDTLSSIVPKVEDIRKAISLGDRFLFQRELFAGNGEKMNKTIEQLNALSSLDEAMTLIERFGWDKESNAYELFTNILKRRW